MSRRRNKQNHVSALVKKQPGKCIYEKGVSTVADKDIELSIKVKWANHLVDEVLEVDPGNKQANDWEWMLNFLGLRNKKESPEAGTSRDSRN